MDLIFDVKEFTILLLGVIFVTLIAGSVQSIYADHILEDGKGIFKDQDQQNLAKTTDSNSKYQIHLQVEIRNVQGQLISIAETSHGYYILEGISDLVFYEKLGEKKIVTIDNIKYEKAQYVDSPMKEDEVDYITMWALMVCGEILGHGHKCVSVFQASTDVGLIAQTDVVTNQWTILRELD
jgi:hypothetical protein